MFDLYIKSHKWKSGLTYLEACKAYKVMVAKSRGKECVFKDSSGRTIKGRAILDHTPNFVEKRIVIQNDESEPPGLGVGSDNSDGFGDEVSESSDRELREAFARSHGSTDTTE